MSTQISPPVPTPEDGASRASFFDAPGGIEVVARGAEPLSLSLARPGRGHVGVRQAFAAYLGLSGGDLTDLGALPGGLEGRRLVALRYIVANGETWVRHFAWREPLAAAVRRHLAETNSEAPPEPAVRAATSRVSELVDAIERAKAKLEPLGDEDAFAARLLSAEGPLGQGIDASPCLEALVRLELSPELRALARRRIKERSRELFDADPRLLDLAYLATFELTRYPASTVSAGELRYVVVADKGEMGVRAVREALALGKTPVTFYSAQDDAGSLQVRLTEENGGIAIGLSGSFRESYGGYAQMTERLVETYRARFGEGFREALARSALYPGYGPLAENAAAIGHFRRSGLAFVGPMQDVVERLGDKRRFRELAERLDPGAVTPGIVIDSGDPTEIARLVRAGHAAGKFDFPGRLKAANGGGGRGQAIVSRPEDLEAAIQKVLGEIAANGWDPGVMFEQNVPETIHLEVQVLRDRYGHTRHFGMRDCSEQRASQKVQEEAPPAILRSLPELRRRIEETAVRIIDEAGYVGAATVELMFKDGAFYFLETNTRIQVEHPVTEESHSIRRPGGGEERLNLVRLQMTIAEGKPIDFEQEDVVPTHVAREFRINAEAWRADVKDSRDGKVGLFLPNAGIFDEIEVPDARAIRAALVKAGDLGEIEDVRVRFDTGFEPGDTLVNKDPTFGKLIVAVRAPRAAEPYELLRRTCVEVLRRTRIAGRQVMPNGKPIEGSEFKNNVEDHVRILEEDVLVRHARGDDAGRHVGWVVAAFRAGAS